MKKMLLIAVAAAMAFSVQAEFKKNPDANTLWSETGGNVNFKNWRLVKDVEPGADKTRFDFVITKGPGCSFGTYVNANPDYPWLVVKVAKAERVPKNYFALTSYFLNGPRSMSFGISTINSGMYVRKINLDPKKKDYFLRFDFSGKELVFDYLGMQKVPEVMPEFANKTLKKGEDLVLTVTLQKPADSVQTKFFRTYTMPQIKLNGKKSMELTPNADKKVWTLKVPFDNFSDVKPEKGVIGENSIMFALEITRGDDTEKVYTNSTFEIIP